MSDLHGIILEILQDREFHTKKSFGVGLTVSYQQIDEVLDDLQASGLAIISSDGLGYRLSDSVELLNKTTIFDYLSTGAPRANCRLEILSVTDSTNRYALEQAGKKISSGLVVLAEKQTAGMLTQCSCMFCSYNINMESDQEGQSTQVKPMRSPRGIQEEPSGTQEMAKKSK